MPQENVEASVKKIKRLKVIEQNWTIRRGFGTFVFHRRRFERGEKIEHLSSINYFLFYKLLPILSRVNKNQTYYVLKRKKNSNILTRCSRLSFKKDAID